jgi:hypothetical protein
MDERRAFVEGERHALWSGVRDDYLALDAAARKALDVCVRLKRENHHPEWCMSWVRGRLCDCATAEAIAALPEDWS